MNDAGSRIKAPSPGCQQAISGPVAGGASAGSERSLGERLVGRAVVLEGA
jgi:hypothetical protein